MKHRLFVFISIVIFITSCSSGHREEASEIYDEQPGASKEAIKNEKDILTQTPEQDEDIIKEKKIIKEAYLNVEVTEYQSEITEIKSIIKRNKGYIAGENEYSSYDAIHNSIEIKVPAEHFNTLIEDICSIVDKVKSKNITADDVTEEFVDIQARLNTKKKFEERYIQLLNQAGKMQEVLEIQREIRKIREEIESIEGRLKYLSDRVSYSTIHLNIKQELPGTYEFGFLRKVWKAIVGGWKGLLHVTIVLFYLWPAAVVLAIVLVIIRIKKRKRTKD